METKAESGSASPNVCGRIKFQLQCTCEGCNLPIFGAFKSQKPLVEVKFFKTLTCLLLLTIDFKSNQINELRAFQNFICSRSHGTETR